MNGEHQQTYNGEGLEQQSPYAPASAKVAAAVLTRSVDAVSLIPYLEIRNANLQDSHTQMIFISCGARVERVALDMVMLDLANVWKATAEPENATLHSFSESLDGFGFKFAVLLPNCTFVTGMIIVDLIDVTKA